LKAEVLNPRDHQANLRNYQETYEKFRWEGVEKEFTWHTTGKVNMAYEAVDRHARSWRENKVALYYIDDFRQEKYTYQEPVLWFLSNRFANVLRSLGIKKEIGFLSSCPALLSFISPFWGSPRWGQQWDHCLRPLWEKR